MPDEAKLKAMKVPELRELLAAASLPTTGVKADLIERLLANPKASSGNKAATASATSVAATAPAASYSRGIVPNVSARPANVPAADGEYANGGEARSNGGTAALDAEESAKVELAKRQERLKRFGGDSDLATAVNEVDKVVARTEKFGTINANDAVKGLAKLDQALGEKRGREKKGKQNGPTVKDGTAAAMAASSTAASSAVKTKAARLSATSGDPVEEEKKRKRAERFGTTTSAANAPIEKKAKA